MSVKSKFRDKKNYDSEKKNKIRQILVDEIRKRNLDKVIALDCKDFLFSKLLPDKEVIVFENDGDVITKMEKKCPKNVDLIFGNISKLSVLKTKAGAVYLDFCGTWMTEQVQVIKLKDYLKDIKLLALTLCLRESAFHKQTGNVYKGDYQFDLINKIQEITGVNWKVVYGESYYDSVQMVTIIMENPNE